MHEEGGNKVTDAVVSLDDEDEMTLDMADMVDSDEDEGGASLGGRRRVHGGFSDPHIPAKTLRIDDEDMDLGAVEEEDEEEEREENIRLGSTTTTTTTGDD